MADENDPNAPQAPPPGAPAQPEPPQDAAALDEPADVPAAAAQPEPAQVDATALDAPADISAPPPLSIEAAAEPATPGEATASFPQTDGLPAGYFRAAGDPAEPEEPTPEPTFLSRAAERWAALRAWAAPRLTDAATRARALGGAAVRRARKARPPRNVREAAVWGGWAATGVALLLIVGFVFVTWGMPSADDVWEARGGQSITFVDRNNTVILREGAQNAPPVDLDSLPPYVAQAFIAVEDRRFYQHFGVDLGGLMRASAQNLRAGRVVQGGSTITQQLAKNLFLTNERTWRRKAQEVALAIWLESKFSKEQILALYLSRVYFGAGAYGVEAAAERYFDRPARELTLLQSAMLAGLVKAPSRLNPARQDMTAARARAEIVLNEMVRSEFISAAERDAAMQEELQISQRNPAGVLGYYRDWIDPLLNEVIGQERDDFVIETTLDITAQRAGAEALNAVLGEQGEERRVSQGALIALDADGGVVTMVGGRDYDVSQFNRATQAHRQPGSSFKFFIYLAAMEAGLTPFSVRDDAPVRISIEGQPDWTPGNYTGEYHGPVTLSSAFAHSYNMVAIRVANEVGGRDVINVARRLGVRSPLSNYHSLALGAQEITLIEMAGAYGAMAADGYRVEPHGVTRIRRANSDEVMWSFRPTNRARVIEDRERRLMNAMMSRVVENGTGTAARVTGRQIGGKTGTGNDYRDAWFVGFVPGLTAGVWVGNDDFSTTARVTGGSLPAQIWRRYMEVALANVPVRELQMPTDADYITDYRQEVAEGPAPVVGAPIGVTIGQAAPTPIDTEDRSLDFGPEG